MSAPPAYPNHNMSPNADSAPWAPFPARDIGELLARHNRLWSERRQCWCASAQPPWWARGLVISPELRGRYESYLPVGEYLASIARLAEAFLPDASWLPSVLQNLSSNGGAPAALPYASIADYWAKLPDGLAGKLCLSADELLPLFCALADPPRYGTITGRYPEQLAELDALFRRWPAQMPLRILDIGCGVGLNTLEIATRAATLATQAGLVVTGLTAERLEVWMAGTRRLPHDPQREKALRAFPRELPIIFAHARAEDFALSDQFDIAICNGLAGGRFLHQHAQISAFLDRCAKALTHAGRLFLANRFHDGHHKQLDAFAVIARDKGWNCTGSPQNLCLQAPV